MSILWEDPPKAPNGLHSGARERSPLRTEVDELAVTLAQNPGRWARLWSFEEREEADKRAGFVRSVFGRGTNVAVRQVEDLWVVFGRFKADQDNESEREPTFQ
jgi:hypothetical protein